eukprot:Gregarina_sp_Poly_1__10811@NODE_833_length_6080_cov_60_392483_g584_i1_p3_GENE_NODE_833_length_6080_cov_60_392483_g584_i1NODE_833_length_6080_cov_60_392483_g584_i1_p3_ORF_typecomplete_len285_score24_75ThiF/PF00899_21/3_2e10_NODE_833_length_6080_cov_60_392483_g584_i151345988
MELTEEEVKLYDRQIRLWGVEAQQRISQSRIVLFRLHNYHSEVGKNLAAAGFNLTLCDDRKFAECDGRELVIPPSGNEKSENQSVAAVCMRRLCDMNSFIKVDVIEENALIDYLENNEANTLVMPYPEVLASSSRLMDVLKAKNLKQPLLAIFTQVLAHGTIVMNYCPYSSYTAWNQSPTEILKSTQLTGDHKNLAIRALHSMARNEGISGGSLPSYYAAIIGGTITQEIRKLISCETDHLDYNCVYLNYDDSSMSVCYTGNVPLEKSKESVPSANQIADVDDD